MERSPFASGPRVKTDNHYITVSRNGELMARRKGHGPVRVATIASGLVVDTDEASRARGADNVVCIRFASGGGNREMRVMAIEHRGETMEVDAFLTRFEVTEQALGRWIRAAIERALNAAQ